MLKEMKKERKRSKVLKDLKQTKLSLILVVIILFILTLLIFGDTIFTSDQVILSKNGTDLSSQFVHLREFGFDQLKNGNLALWNPHIFSGMPYFGGFQSALLYPLNLVYLLFSLPKAINISIAIHLFLLGLFVYIWLKEHNIHPFAALTASILMMFSGPFFLHIYAGHLPNLSTMIWAPLLFFAIDKLAKRFSWQFILVGVVAVTLQILAGHPQYFYYTAIAAGFYTLLKLIKNDKWLNLLISFVAIYLIGVCLGAVQLFTGLSAGAESVRSGAVPFQFASMFSFPPENILTLFMPGFFGNMDQVPYWGRCYLWEMSLFISVTGITFAVIGSFYGKQKIKKYLLYMIGILFLFALGAHTPLFRVFYYLLPGFNKFRGSSKFIFQLSLFLVFLTAIGFDYCLKLDKQKKKKIVIILLSFSLFFLLFSVVLGNTNVIKNMSTFIKNSNESYLHSNALQNIQFINQISSYAAKSGLICALIFFLIAGLLYLSKYSLKFKYLILLLGIIEILIFAISYRSTFTYSQDYNYKIDQVLNQDKDDYRILRVNEPNIAMTLNASDIWGYDPGVLKRYAEFMYFTQKQNPDQASQYLRIANHNPLYKMLRLKYVFVPDPRNTKVYSFTNLLSKAQLIYDVIVLKSRSDIFQFMAQPGFNPVKQAILEQELNFELNVSDSEAKLEIVKETTDYKIIKANLNQPALLILTDNYSQGWQVTSLTTSSQKEYEVLPANYILLGIPLEKGEHHLKIEYKPKAFQVGLIISIVTFLFIVGFLVYVRFIPVKIKFNK